MKPVGSKPSSARTVQELKLLNEKIRSVTDSRSITLSMKMAMHSVRSRLEGMVTGWLGARPDIHSIKRAAVALASSEASFRQFADAMPQMVWTATPDGAGD